MQIKVTYKGNKVSKQLSLLNAMLIHRLSASDAIALNAGYTLENENFTFKAVLGFDGIRI